MLVAHYYKDDNEHSPAHSNSRQGNDLSPVSPATSCHHLSKGQTHAQILRVRAVEDRVKILHEGLAEHPKLHIVKLGPNDAHMADVQVRLVVLV